MWSLLSWRWFPLQRPQIAALPCASLPQKSKSILSLTAAQPAHTEASHTCWCHHTHTVVTTPNGLLLRALVCCRIPALNKNFITYLRKTFTWLHIFIGSVWLSLKELPLSGIGLELWRPPCPRGEHTIESRGILWEDSKAVENLIVLPLDHLYRSAHLTSSSPSAQFSIVTAKASANSISKLYPYLVQILGLLACGSWCVTYLANISPPHPLWLWSSYCLCIEPSKNSKKMGIVLICSLGRVMFSSYLRDINW